MITEKKDRPGLTRLENNLQNPFGMLDEGIYSALKIYSNVHRGSGQKSIVTTRLYEEARSIILDYLDLDSKKYSVIFNTPRSSEMLKQQIQSKDVKILSSEEIGLPVGVRAVIARKSNLPRGVPFHGGGGTARLISTDWIIWEKGPAKFEAGTPPIINIIAFALALKMVQKFGKEIFLRQDRDNTPVPDILLSGEYKRYKGIGLLTRLREERIGKVTEVPTVHGYSRYINFDNSASTSTFEPIWKAYRQSLHLENASHEHLVHEVKDICAEFLGAPLSDYDIYFTSNTTEAINLAAENLGKARSRNVQEKIITTLLEHSSNDLPWRLVPGHTVMHVTVDPDGNIDIGDLEMKLSRCNAGAEQNEKQVRMVAVSGASNVLGTATNIEEISEITHKYGASILVDAAQMVAHKRINMKAADLDMLAFSAHKIYAPFGCGVLVMKKGLNNFSKEENIIIQKSGEENIAGIAAMGSVLTLFRKIGMSTIEEEEKRLTALTLRGMSSINGLKVYGINDPDSTFFQQKIGVIPFNFNDIISFKVGKLLALKSGIGVRVGCHCAHIIVKHTLKVGPGLEKFQRMIQSVFPALKFPGLVRVSLGLENDEEDVNQLLIALKEISVNSKAKDQKIGEANAQLEEYVLSKVEDVYSV